MATSNVTRRALSLGSADSTTGWYAKSFATSTIEMVILKRGQVLIGSPIGLYARHDYTGWTDDTIAEGDETLDANSNYYQVNSVAPIYLGDSLYCYECDLNKMALHGDSPTTSGTWISVTDPSNRIKVLLDTYLTVANMKEDDNSTNATTLTAFGLPNYPIQLVFLGSKNVDLVFSVDKANSTALIDSDYSPYGYIEHVPLKLFAIDKSGVTARRLIWAGEHEVRRILETYPTGSHRLIEHTRDNTQTLGSTILHSSEYTITWKRDLT